MPWFGTLSTDFDIGCIMVTFVSWIESGLSRFVVVGTTSIGSVDAFGAVGIG